VNGEPSFADQQQDILMNPTIIAEIFSNKTNTTDKNEKLESYLAMDSIRECLLIKEDEMRVEHYAKQNPKQWIYRIYNERDDVISLESVNCKLSLQEVYASLKFKQPEASSTASK
jgi:Uma2 family endonuclease